MDGRPRITPVDIERYIKWANEKIYITLPENGDEASWDWLFDKFKEQMYSFGVNIFIVDAFNKVRLPKGNKLDEINAVLTRLTSFCQINNVSVLLVAHPTKMKKGDDGAVEVPTLYDVSGSSDFRNQAHNGFAIHRHFDTEQEEGYSEFVNLKTKFSFQGNIGERVEFTYDKPTGRMYAKGTPVPLFDLTMTEEPEQKIIPNMEFDKYSDFDNPPPALEF
jgi:twinkle protein